MISVIRVRLKGHTLFPLVLSGCLGLLSGCANNYPTQVVYTDTAEEGSLVTGIQTYQFNLTTGPRYMQAGAAARNGDVGDKKGHSTRYSTLFGLVEWGNNGVGTAAASGGVREVRTVQNGGIDVLWGIVYSEQTTIVTGSSEYTNRLPIKLPGKAVQIKEGFFVDPKGDVLVKNENDQLLATIPYGAIRQTADADGQEYEISFSPGKNAMDKTVTLRPSGKVTHPVTFLVNDHLVTVEPGGRVKLLLEGENKFVVYEGLPTAKVKIQSADFFEPQAVDSKISEEKMPQTASSLENLRS